MKNRRLLKPLTLILVVALLTAGLTACSAQAQGTSTAATSATTAAQTTAGSGGLKTLNLGYPIAGVDFIGGVAGIAQEEGYLDEELKKAGYAITYQGFVGAGPAVNEALASGKLDLALYADFPGLVIQSKGVDTKLLSVVTQVAHAGIVVAKDSPVKTVADLKGKKIAFPKGTYVQKYLYQVLEANGLKQTDVELINMTADAESALLSGAVDAVAFTDSYIAKIAYGPAAGRIINTTRENADWTGATVLIARNAYIKENRAAGVAILRALIRAKAYAKANPEKVYQLFADKTKISLEASKYLNNLDNNQFDYFTLDVSATGQAKLTANKRFLLDSQLIQKDFDVYTWGDNSYYEEAAK
jgi:sulfonate transport system substrate-binding protein